MIAMALSGALFLFSASPSLAQSLKKGACLPYADMVDVMKSEGQNGMVFGNALQPPDAFDDASVEIGGERFLGRNVLKMREMLDTASGYRSTAAQLGGGRDGRERVDRMRLALESAFLHAVPSSAAFRITFSSNRSGTFGYVLVADRPVGVTATIYCVKVVLHDVSVVDETKEEMPKPLAKLKALGSRIRFNYEFGLNKGVAYYGNDGSRYFVVMKAAGRFGSLYAGNDDEAVRIVSFDELQYGAVALEQLRR